MAKTTISRKRDKSNRDELKSLEQWDNERKIVQEEINRRKLLIDKYIELQKLIIRTPKTKNKWLESVN